tara:strand:- start:227 stop:1111 length:885 start_codon:yes stop_codon:yes gene_type:complete
MFLNDFPFILKVISSFLFFFSGLLWKKILDGRANYNLIIYRTLFSLFFLFIPQLILFRSYDYFSFSPLRENGFKTWGLSILICFFSFFGLYFFTKAIQEGRFLMVLPLSSLTSVFAVISAFIFFNQVPSGNQISAFILVILALGVHQFDKLKLLNFDKEIYFILLSTFFWGVSFTLYLIPIDFFGPVNFSLILEFIVLISAWCIMAKNENQFFPPKIDKGTLIICALIGICVAFGSLFSNIALSEVSVVVNVLISLIFEAVVLLCGLYYLAEKINNKDWLLIICITVSSILIMF